MFFWVIAILVLVFGWIYPIISLLYGRKNELRLPPGPPALPVIGNLHILGNLPHQNLHILAKKYGSIMYMRFGFAPAVVVSSPKAAELFLKTHDHIFSSRPKTQAAELMTYGCKGLAFAPYGSYWRNMRKMCTIELLSNIKIESFKAARKEEVDNLVRSMREVAEAGMVVDLSSKVGLIIEDLTYKMVFGSSNDSNFNIRPVILESLRLSGAFNLADYVPYIGAFDLQGLNRRMKAVSRTVDEFLNAIIDDHVRDDRYGEGRDRDFVDVLLSLMKKSKETQEEEEEQVINRTNIKAILLDMLAAAMDTTATTIEWAMAELIKHPMVMKRLQDELETVVGLDRTVEEMDLHKLNYLNMVVKESMRLHPVAPLLLPHESMEDVMINGYHIPKNCRVLINTWSIGRNPEVWSHNAEQFLPERFVGIDIDVRGRNFQLLPFGSGRRGCPGMQLGLTMVRVVLAQLVHCFNWELPNGMSPDKLDMSEKFGLSLPRANHLLALPTYRLHVKTM